MAKKLEQDLSGVAETLLLSLYIRAITSAVVTDKGGS